MRPRVRRGLAPLLVGLTLLAVPAPIPADEPKVGVPVEYRLPTDGPLPRTYCVTLAVVDPKNPDWIISQFACGAVRTVTAENQGKFTEQWDGLDDNFMPVPPGTYAVKGVFMPARKWKVDDEYHTVTPRFLCGASSWMPSPDEWRKPEPFGGDPVGVPLRDIAVGPNGVAVFYWEYLENGTNNPLFDLKTPIGYGQFLRAFNSGGAGGGTCTATDGETVWSFSTDGGPKYVYRADGKPFGSSPGANRPNSYPPEGWVTALAAWRDQAAKKTFVYVAQRGKIVERRPHEFAESATEFVDKVAVLDGDDGKTLAEAPLPRPRGLAVHDGALYALHTTDGGFAVSTVPLKAGLPKGTWQRLFTVPASITPFDLEVDGHGRVYLSDPDANHVFQFSGEGKRLQTYGRLDRQKAGAYDPQTLMAPGKLATWTDPEGNDRLLIVEQAGPNRASEWSADGKLLREFLPPQTKANDGYAIDPEDPEHIYMAGQQGWLTRFRVDYDKPAWTVDAVWPDVGTDPKAPGFDHPKLINRDGRKYLACARSYNVYRLQDDRWLLSAAVIREHQGDKWKPYLWQDADGDGRVREEEYRRHAVPLPGAVLRYHGEQWLDDLSLAAMNQAGREVWRLEPNGFDAHGNPIFSSWEKLLTDPIFEARAKGTADAVHGGNELDDRFSSDWAMTDGSVPDGFYVNARGGHSFSANEGAQVKISRYVPDGRGGYRLRWRTGRAALQGLARPGEIYGAIHLHKPINGLLSVVDQSRCGVLLYTEDGLYVDTVFPDGRRFSPSTAGVYPQPGEFFAGDVYANRDNGKIYFAMGKVTPMLFEAEGWSLKENPVRPLEQVQKTVRITAAQIASPPEIALSVHGGAGTAKVARFAPALGGPALDGSPAGWESCEPVLAHVLDEDGKGFVLTAAIPRTALPPMPALEGGWRTMVNFEATFDGHNKFWWADSDGSASREAYDEPTEARLYPGSWAPAQFQGLGQGVLVRNGLVCGPWGGPSREKFHADPADGEKDEVKKACEAAHYPPDDGVVDLKAVFKGPDVRGYWPDPGEVRWTAAATADLDTRVILGLGAQVWYGATWIYAPAETELEFQFQGHPQTDLRFFLNGKPVQTGEIPEDPQTHQCVAKKKAILRQGWNEVRFRGYCVGYPPFSAGLVLAGPSEKLWTLRLSARPPRE